jgi:peptidoglycan/xylan/chitin deacetylase (PgdA/CDA1 family)
MWYTLALCLAFAQLRVSAQTQHIPGVSPVPIDATPEQMKQAVAGVRAGRKLTPKSWPNGSRIAVSLNFDIDNETLWRETPLPVPLSAGEYGATTGLPRILDLLDRQRIPATFFIPAMSSILHPEMVPEILKRKRHEIGVHGWVHEELPMIGDAAKEERLITQSIDYLTTVTGKRPVGFRAPSWEFSPSTLDHILKAGFLYDTSLMAMDEPYEVISNEKPAGLIELPINWILDDYPYYEPDAAGSLPLADEVFKVYKHEFDGAYQERTLFVLTMHPHITGHRSRIVALEELITYMKSKPGVWFATLAQIANYVKQADRKQ